MALLSKEQWFDLGVLDIMELQTTLPGSGHVGNTKSAFMDDARTIHSRFELREKH